MAKNNVEIRSKVILDGSVSKSHRSTESYRTIPKKRSLGITLNAIEKSGLQTVIRGLPMSTELVDNAEHVSTQGIVVHSVHRMYSSKAPGRELPLILVKVRRDQGKILKITRCLDLPELKSSGKEHSSAHVTDASGTATTRPTQNAAAISSMRRRETSCKMWQKNEGAC